MQVCCAGLGLQKGCKMLPIRNFKCLAEFLLRVGIGKEWYSDKNAMKSFSKYFYTTCLKKTAKLRPEMLYNLN